MNFYLHVAPVLYSRLQPQKPYLRLLTLYHVSYHLSKAVTAYSHIYGLCCFSCNAPAFPVKFGKNET